MSQGHHLIHAYVFDILVNLFKIRYTVVNGNSPLYYIALHCQALLSSVVNAGRRTHCVSHVLTPHLTFWQKSFAYKFVFKL